MAYEGSRSVIDLPEYLVAPADEFAGEGSHWQFSGLLHFAMPPFEIDFDFKLILMAGKSYFDAFAVN